jgi:hypothetical protein
MGCRPTANIFSTSAIPISTCYDVAREFNVNISAKAPVSFFDDEEDHPYPNPSFGVAGWTKDGKSVIVNHKFDLWTLNIDGSGGESHR